MLSRVITQALQAFRSSKDALPGRDWRALKRRLPALSSLEAQTNASRALLAPLYERYVTAYSTAQWAMSLETACVLHALCTIFRPGKVLDTGSGFSSAVLRLHARDVASCAVDSVDEDANWMGRTAAFLKETGLSGGRLALWSDAQSWQDDYDLILHDMGRIELRSSSLGFVISRVSAGGLLLIDDMQYEGYNAIATRECEAGSLTLASLRHLTLDGFGRYASLAVR